MTITQNINIPELRFPEFDGEWIEKKFENAVERSKSKYNPAKEKENFLCIELESLSQETGLLLNTFNSKTLKSIKNKFKKGEILFGKLRPYLKKFYKADFNGVCSSEIWVLSGKESDNNFIYYLIQTFKFNYKINLTIGSKMPRAEWNHISNVTFYFPTLPEQQKIASFLTAIDKRIKLLTQKHTLLEQYKKGVMQKIFSQELRFKDEDGNDFPEWKEKKLGEILNYEQPTKYLVSDTKYCDSYKVPVLTAGKTFLLGYTDESEGVFIDNLPTIIFDDFTTAFQYVDFPFKAKSSAMKMLIPKNDSVNIKFVFEAMKTIKFPLAEHKRYWISEYQHEKIIYPCIDEQQKIAQFLSAIDKKIEQVTIQIEKNKRFKKGLLQKMFV